MDDRKGSMARSILAKVAATKSRPAHRHDAKKMLRVIARLDTQEDGSENSCRVSINTGRKEITDVTFDRDDLPDIEELHDDIIEDISAIIEDPRHTNGKFVHRLFMVKTLPSGKTLDFQGLQTNAALEYYVRGLPTSAKTCELAVRYVSKEKTRRVGLASSSPSKANGSGGKTPAAKAEAAAQKAPSSSASPSA